jgi:5-methylcytosine-specific restriction endonuclease McrA
MGSTTGHPTSRQQAIDLGLKHYFPGPCKRGHASRWLVSAHACMECMKAARRSYRERHPEREKESQRKVDVKRAGAKKEYLARRYAADPSFYTKRNPRKYEKSPEKWRAWARAWKKANPEKARAVSANCDARRRGAPGSHTAGDIEALLRRQRAKCANCGASLRKGYHVDHIMPLAKGGSNDPGNLQLLCPGCNQRKSAKHPLEWACENGRLL